ncbi:xanthine dehydrogenase family protein molybdopterin-binding subunit [Mycolicibacterium sp. CBM1]
MTRVGSEFARRDVDSKTAGRARYTNDLVPRHAVHAAAVRSPYAAATITAIDVTKALAAPGVVHVMTADSAPGIRLGHFAPDEPLLASGEVRYVGEPVALVAAETPAQARAAATLVSVEYEVLEPVIDLRAAADPGSRQVHRGEPNYTQSSHIRRGDVEAAFAAADVVVTTVTEGHRVHQSYIEPRASIAEYADGELTVITSSQAPFEVRAGLGRLFGLPLTRVHVRVPTLGGGFGGKLHLGMAAYASALAIATGRPVSMLCSREEEFSSPAPRENSWVELTSAVSANGEILARKAKILLDSGAYNYDTPPIGSVAALQACGPYRVDAVDIVAGAVYTNTVPTGSFRGPSGPQMCYAVDAHMQDIAETLGIDALELRERCALRTGDLGPTAQVMRHPAITDVLAEGRKRLEQWRADPAPAKPGRRRGFGLSAAIWTISPVGSAVTLSVHEDGSATVATGATEIGTGAVSDMLPALAADGLGITADEVHLAAGDTERGLFDHGSQGSRTLYGVGTALNNALDEVRRTLFSQHSKDTGIPYDDLELADGVVRRKSDPASATQLGDVVGAAMLAGGPVAATGRFQPSPVEYATDSVEGWVGAFNEPTFHCHAVELDIDEATGAIEILRYAAIHDSGPVLNPHGARGQIEGGIAQGLGYALSEAILTDAAGCVRNPNLHDYRLPTMADGPDTVEVVFVTNHPSAEGVLGAKGIGEAPAIPGAAAVGAAVRDALGMQPQSTSMTPENILRLIEGLAPSTMPRTEAR